MNGFTAMLMDEQAAALTEYALILALISVATFVALNGLGQALITFLNNLSTSLQQAQTG